MNVELRGSNAADAEFLIELYRESRRGEVSAWGWSDEQIDAFIGMQYAARQQAYAAQHPQALDSIILKDGVKAGRLLIAESEDEMRLVDIAVMPALQGRGIGTFVIRRLLESAVEVRKPVRLRVASPNPARRLYERLGFATIDEAGGYLQMEFLPAPRIYG